MFPHVGSTGLLQWFVLVYINGYRIDCSKDFL